MPVHIRAFRNDLDLQLDGRDFEIADERIHDVPLLSRAAEQEVDRHDLQDLDKSVVGRVDNAVFDFLNRHIHRKRIAGALGLLLLPIGGVQHQAACVLCKMDAAAVLFIGGRLHSRTGAGLFIPRRENGLLSAAFAAVFAQGSAVAEETKKQNDIGGKRHPRDPDERQKRQRQRGQAEQDDPDGQRQRERQDRKPGAGGKDDRLDHISRLE